MLLTAETLSVLDFQNVRKRVELDESGNKYLNTNLGIDYSDLKSYTTTNSI